MTRYQNIHPVLLAALLLAFVRSWPTTVPYGLDPLGTGGWSMVVSNLACSLLPVLLVAALRFKPLPRRTVVAVSAVCALTQVCVVALWYLDTPLGPVVESSPGLSAALLAVWSLNAGWYYNLMGALIASMGPRSMSFVAFVGPALVALSAISAKGSTTFGPTYLLLSVAAAFAIVCASPWDSIKEADERRMATIQANPYLGDILRAIAPLVLYCLAWGAVSPYPHGVDAALAEPTYIASWAIAYVGGVAACALMVWHFSVKTLARLLKIVAIASVVGLTVEMLPHPMATSIGCAVFSGFSNLAPGISYILSVLFLRGIKLPAYASFTLLAVSLIGSLAVGQTIGCLISESFATADVFLTVCIILLVLSISTIGSMERWTEPYVKGVGTPSKPAQRSYDGDARALRQIAQSHGLSPREVEIADLLRRGRTYEYCALALGISVNTTRTHIRKMYRKLDINSREELLDMLGEQQGR